MSSEPAQERAPDARREPTVDEGRQRRRQRRFGGAVGSLLVLAIVLMVNYLAFRHYHRWDWTEDGLFTLSDRSVTTVRALESPLDLYLFLGANEPQHDEVRELLDRYRAESTQITLHEVDPDRQQAEYRVLADRFHLMEGQVSDVAVLIKGGERTWKITRDDLLDVDMATQDDPEGPTLDVKSEQAITAGILQVVRGRATKLCLSAGHGEWAVGGAGDRDFRGVGELLQRDNIEVETVTTLESERVPEGCDALWVVGPLRPFSDREVELVERYVEGGGNLLLALDPVLRDQAVQPTGFERMLRGWGVRVDADLAVERDPYHRLRDSGIDTVVVNHFGEDVEWMSRLSVIGAPVVLQIARSVRPLDDAPDVHPLLTGTERSFGIVDLSALATAVDPEPGPDDVAGPISLGVSLTRHGSAPQGEEGAGGAGGRVVVLGDADFLQPQLLGEPQFANIDFLGAATGWLTERQELISIAPRRRNARSVVMTAADLTGVLIRVAGLVPLALILLGVSVWWSRRQ